jgi:hypothetical protein
MTMPICDQGFEHAAPEPEVIPVPVDSGPNENSVAIAEIEAAASIQREKLYNAGRDADLVLEVERQRGEITGMREILDRIAPPAPDPDEIPASVPVVVTPGPVGEMPEEVAAPADVEKKAPKESGGYWSGYDKG